MVYGKFISTFEIELKEIYFINYVWIVQIVFVCAYLFPNVWLELNNISAEPNRDT